MLINGILLILLSLLAVPSLLLAKKPDAKPMLDKLVPYQGWFGLVSCFYGIWGIISAVLTIGWLGSYPIYWVIGLLYAIVEATLGFSLGYGLIVEYALKTPEAKAKGDTVLAKLQPFQGTLGIVGICVGLCCIVASFVWVVA